MLWSHVYREQLHVWSVMQDVLVCGGSVGLQVCLNWFVGQLFTIYGRGIGLHHTAITAVRGNSHVTNLAPVKQAVAC